MAASVERSVNRSFGERRIASREDGGASIRQRSKSKGWIRARPASLAVPEPVTTLSSV